MSTHTYAFDAPAPVDAILAAARSAGLPDGLILTTPTGVTLTYTPNLTAGQVSTLDGIIAVVRSGLSQSLYDSVRPHIQTLRTFRQRSRNDFIALTQNDRDRALYDAVVAATVIFLALLREPD